MFVHHVESRSAFPILYDQQTERYIASGAVGGDVCNEKASPLYARTALAAWGVRAVLLRTINYVINSSKAVASKNHNIHNSFAAAFGAS